MIEFNKISNIWFIGVGGIGMSALARYFVAGGFSVAGYDRVESAITRSLIEEGIGVTYRDEINDIPDEFRDAKQTLVIYTPAIPRDNRIFNYFVSNDFRVHKRSEVLGMISRKYRSVAIAGTHGKTSVSTLTAHLLKQSHIDCTAFLGGISRNYLTNMLIGESDITIMEADEFDRSFHQLEPEMALITSMDADHLDVYGDYDNMIKAYDKFIAKITDNGILILNDKIAGKLEVPDRIRKYTYGFNSSSDFHVSDLKIVSEEYHFKAHTPWGVIENLSLLIPGRLNIENSLGAISAALLAGVDENDIRKALIYYKGVMRRFDVRINNRNLLYIDDYAHHPEELNYCIESVKEFYGERSITGIFQPHLYSRTRDHADGFAASLDKLDKAIILPVYPAREEPIPGVDSRMIYDRMKMKNKKLATKEELPAILESQDIDVLLTLGAGDIDRMVDSIENILNKKTS